MKFNLTTKTFRYPFKFNKAQIKRKILVLTIFLLFIYCCIFSILRMEHLVDLLVCLIIIQVYKLIRNLILHCLIGYIESFNDIENKRQLLKNLNVLYHALYIHSYIINKNIYMFLGLVRKIYDLLDDQYLKVQLTRCFLFFFHYPFTRLHLLVIMFCNRLLNLDDDKSFLTKGGSYMVDFLLCLFLFNHFVIHLSISRLCIFYLLFLVFILPWLHGIFIRFEYLQSYNEVMLFYPTIKYVQQKRDKIHVLSLILKAYPENVIVANESRIFFQYNNSQIHAMPVVVEFNIKQECFLFYSVGIHDKTKAMFLHCYVRTMEVKNLYYLENNRLISYVGYEYLHSIIEFNWQTLYIGRFLYEKVVNDDECIVNTDLLHYIHSLISEFSGVLALALNLLWDVEKDGQLHDHIIILSKSCPISFSSCGLFKVNVYDYHELLITKQSHLNKSLENKILYFVSNAYPRLLSINSIFNENGYCLMDDFCPVNDDYVDEGFFDNYQLELKKLAYFNFSVLAFDFIRDKPYHINKQIIGQFHDDVIILRQHWQSINK